jgi:undecaprenyl-diphosphatase
MISLESNRLEDFDARVDGIADRLRGKRIPDRGFYALTEAANHSILWHTINAVGFVTGRRSKADVAGLAVSIAMESALVNGGLKKLFKRDRPITEAIRPHKLRNPKTTSFPSGHATSAFCAAVLLSDRSRPGTKLATYALASAVSYSRVHVRIHHASDVVGGAIIGIALGKLFLGINRRAKARRLARGDESHRPQGPLDEVTS